jgi:hypothetical protein
MTDREYAGAHEVICSASRDKPVGCPGCSCRAGREIKRLRADFKRVDEQATRLFHYAATIRAATIEECAKWLEARALRSHNELCNTLAEELREGAKRRRLLGLA